jgi:hypothetical protein
MIVRSRRDAYHERLRKTASRAAADDFRRQYIAKHGYGAMPIANLSEREEAALEVRLYDYAIAGGMICC